MKKILFLLLICVPVFSFSQRLFPKGIIISENGDTINQANYDYLVNRVTVLEAGRTDVTAPTIDSIVATDSVTVNVYFDESITETLDTSSINLYRFSTQLTINTISTSTSVMTLTSTEAMRRGQSLSFEYITPSSGYITDLVGNVFAPIGTYPITNRIPDKIISGFTLVSAYDFEDVLTDDIRSGSQYNAVASTGFNYSDWFAHGTKGADFDLTDSYLKIPPLNPSTGAIGIFAAFELWGLYDFNKHLIGNRKATGGWEVKMNQTERVVEVWTFNSGGDSAMAYSSADYTLGQTTSLAINIDSINGDCDIWINGVNANVDSIFRNDFQLNDTIWIGAEYSNTFKLYGRMDYLNLFDGKITQTKVDELHGSIIYEIPSIDTIAPVCDTASFGFTGDSTLVISLSEPIKNTSINMAAFKLYADGAQMTAYSYIIEQNKIIIVYESASAGDSISLEFDDVLSSGITDDAGNVMLGFTQHVRNTLTSSVYIYGRWLFNNDATDEEGNYDGVEGANVNYVTSPVVEGTHAANANGTGKEITVSGISETQYLSFHGAVYTVNSGGAGYISTMVDDNDGWELRRDSDGSLTFETDNGATDDEISSSAGAISISQYYNVGFSWDMDADTVALYIDGSYVAGGAVTDNTPADEKIYFGRSRSIWIYGYWDAYQLYGSLLTASDFSSLNTNPGAVLDGSTPDDPGDPGDPDDPENPIDPGDPITSGDFRIYFRQDFSQHTAPLRYTDALWAADWNNPGYRDAMLREQESRGHWSYGPAGVGYTPFYDSIIYSSALGANTFRVTKAADVTLGYFNPLAPEINNNFNWYRGGDYWRTLVWSDKRDAPQEIYLSYWFRVKPGFIQGGSSPGSVGNGGKFPFMNGGKSLDQQSQTELIQPGIYEGWSGALHFNKYQTLRWYVFLHKHPWEDPEWDTRKFGASNHWSQPVSEQWAEFDYYDGADEGYIGDFVFSDNTWYHITLRFVHNTFSGNVANSNGIMQAFINGKLVDTWSGLYLIPYDNYGWGIGEIAFAVQHQFMQREEWLEVADIVVWDYDPSGEGVITGQTSYPVGTILTVPGYPTAGE